MVNSVQNYDAAKDEQLGVLMDEAVSIVPRCSFVRIRTIVRDAGECVTALVLCAAAETPVYKWFALQDKSSKRIPSATVRTQTIHEVIGHAFNHGCDISCYTTDPDLYLYVTLDPTKISRLFDTFLTN